MSAPTIRFDDEAGLRARISDEYGEWGPQTRITQAVIDRFADLTDDHQWIHVDTERAKDGPFGTTIAHGFLILAMLPRVRPSLGFEVTGESSRVNYGAESYRFLAPVPAGSTLHARGRLVDVRMRPQGTLLVSELMVGVVGAERPSALYTGMLLHKP
ncbi:MAG TPA: MaoC family dehydratase [Ilumatobacter sp.]|nr:MaoC family dehydratase [Ilumatobacter sp.]